MDELQELIDRIGTDNPPTLDELTGAQTELARLIRAEAGNDSPDLEVLTSLRSAYDTVTEAIDAENTRLEELRTNAGQILDGVIDPDAAEGDEQPSGEGEGEGETVGEGENANAEPTPTPTPSALSIAEAAARVRVSEPQRQPDPEPEPDSAQTTVYVRGQEIGAELTIVDLAEAFQRYWQSPANPDHKYSLISVQSRRPDGPMLTDNREHNTQLIEEFTSPEAVAAAGGCCALPTPIRTQTVLSSQTRPIRDSLGSFSVAEAGSVVFFPAVCLPQTGVDIWTCDDDAAVDPGNEATWKQCSDLDCDEEENAQVHGVYKCATVGEFQRRFATQQWTAKLQALLAQQARVADVELFTQMLAKVKSTHTGVATGSLLVNLIQTVQLAADTIRQDQRYENVMLHLWAAGWIRGAIRNDLIARRLVDAENPIAVDQFITQALAAAGVNVTWSLDIDTIEDGSQVDGPLTPYPDTAATVLAPEGYYTFLDGGQFDLGSDIKDFDLARQNVSAAFAESFEGLMARGCNAKRLNIPVEVCDIAAGCGAVS